MISIIVIIPFRIQNSSIIYILRARLIDDDDSKILLLRWVFFWSDRGGKITSIYLLKKIENYQQYLFSAHTGTIIAQIEEKIMYNNPSSPSPSSPLLSSLLYVPSLLYSSSYRSSSSY
jgi:hypothetical protein